MNSMNAVTSDRLIGKGVYSVAEASRLTGVPSQTIRRWISGYSYEYRGQSITREPFLAHDLPSLGGQISLTFQELIEVRFVHRFRKLGVSWNTIRIAASKAAELLGRPHPFTSLRFQTDGKAIFAKLGQELHDDSLLDLAKNQWAIRQIIQPGLIRQLEYADSSEDHLLRWWPLGKSRRVVVDPERAFGQPVCSDEGVPTSVIYEAYGVNESYADVAAWYEISTRSVKDAVAFEMQIVA